MFTFVRVSSGGVGKEVVEAPSETPLGRLVFEGPNTVSRELFALSVIDDEQVLLSVLSSSSRLKVVRGTQETDLRQQHSTFFLVHGDVLQLLGTPDLMAYRFEAPAVQGAAKRAKKEDEEKKLAVVSVDRSASASVSVSGSLVKSASVASAVSSGKSLSSSVVGVASSLHSLGRSGSSSSKGFVPVPFKFYRNLVALDGFDNSQNVLNLRPLFAEPGVIRICLTSYELEAEWLLRAFPILQTTEVFVACRAAPIVCPPNWRHVSPQVPPYGTCHGKLMLLYFASKLRVILTSANHIEGDHLFKSNAIWTQDFPLLEVPLTVQAHIGYRADQNDFGAVLQDYLEKLGIPPLYSDLRRFNFSGAAVALVSSVPGAHKVRMKYGYARLAQVLAAEGCLGDGKNPLVMQCSSLGKMSQPFLDAITSTLGGGKMKLIWPSTEFIRTSLQGYGAGGSVCFNAKNLIGPTKSILRLKYEGVPERANVSPHIKTMFRLKAGRELLWMYMGSHNLSKASWGEEQLQGKQFKILSFEIGVVFLPSLVSRCAGSPVTLLLGNGNASDPPRAHGQIIMPIPYRYPASQYSASYGGGMSDTPWQWDVPQQKPDMLGRAWPGIGNLN